MTEIYVGKVNVTNNYVKFQGMVPKTSVDGSVNRKERKKYIAAINHLQKSGAISSQKAATFRDLINSKCAHMTEADDLYLALYEELTQYIESPAFEKIEGKKAVEIKASLAALQMDVYQALNIRGYSLNRQEYLGTSSETPYTSFKANDETSKIAQKIPLDLNSCQLDLSTVEGEKIAEDGMVDPVEKANNPRYKKGVGGPASFDRNIIQTDIRYDQSRVPGKAADDWAADLP